MSKEVSDVVVEGLKVLGTAIASIAIVCVANKTISNGYSMRCSTGNKSIELSNELNKLNNGK